MRSATSAGADTQATPADRVRVPSLLDHPIETLPGIGPKSAKALADRGYVSVGDLLWLLPKGYLDHRHDMPFDRLEPGAYGVTSGRVVGQRTFRRGSQLGLEVRLEARSEGEGEATADGQELKLVWFRTVPGMRKRFEVGTVLRVAGTVAEYRGLLSIAHPEVLDPEQPGAIACRYPVIPGIRRKMLQRAVRAAADRAVEQVPDLIPDAVRVDAGVEPIGKALRSIHVPEAERFDELEESRRRLALEELVLWELSLRVRRAKEQTGTADRFPPEPAISEARQALPFELTDAQQGAVAALAAGLDDPTPMRRLLQGDVGCGKTAVALVACAQVARGGAQSVFLAPTELLADQHAATLRPIAERLGLRLGLFTGALSKDRRRSMLDLMASGGVDLVVGTHALLSGGVRFANLGLIVVDEQHRFGVAQRLRLSGRGPEHQPHLLVMTATPIPRSLALVLYAGLDLTTIDEKPPGRIPAETRKLVRSARAKVFRHIERALEAGGRAYVVCPAISGSDDLVGVDQTVAELEAHFGAGRVHQIHGRLSAEARRARMLEFDEGSCEILVGTTVLEVGVDVPTANIIVIEQAERFGLAQLHQLRGRVGRAGQRSACLLTHAEPLSEEAEARLEALCNTDDGFQLAEIDLALRGPGHLFGYRQSGASGLQFADLSDRELLAQAGELADRIVSADPRLEAPEHAAARAAVSRWEDFAAVREESG